MDQANLGKIGNKVEESGSGKAVSQNPSKTEQSTATPVSTSDTVNLTSDAKLLERLDRTLAGLPAVNAERVDEIKSAIENGEYEIDSDAIAEAMIRLDRSLGE